MGGGQACREGSQAGRWDGGVGGLEEVAEAEFSRLEIT